MGVRSKPWIAALAAAGILAGCATTEPADGGGDEVITTGSTDSIPPPSPAPVISDTDAGGMIVTSRVIGGAATSAMKDRSMSDVVIAPPERIPEPRPDQPEPQAGMLTAGDYDDVLNPSLYKAYLDQSLQGKLSGKDLPFVDADQRIAIKVVDRLGKPMPLAKVSLISADGSPMFPLRTGADGTAYIYPNYDALSAGMTVSVTVEGAQSLRQTLSEQRLKEGGELTFDMSRDTAQIQQLDLLLTLDATGSMSDEMRYLQVELVTILDRLKSSNPTLDIRAGFIVYRDTGDDYVVRQVPFTDDLTAFKTQLSAQSSQGGGDFPEAMQAAMKAGLDFEWRKDAIKVNMLVADAPPHDKDISATWDSALISRSRGIHIVPLAASGVDDTAEFLMRAMAQLTGGRYMFLTDDSGIGNPHAEPTVDCYVVTRLDGLVLRVLKSLVTGVRVEPDGDNVIRAVGNYRAGTCKIDDAQVG